jgi:hypothetical protein
MYAYVRVENAKQLENMHLWGFKILFVISKNWDLHSNGAENIL